MRCFACAVPLSGGGRRSRNDLLGRRYCAAHGMRCQRFATATLDERFPRLAVLFARHRELRFLKGFLRRDLTDALLLVPRSAGGGTPQLLPRHADPCRPAPPLPTPWAGDAAPPAHCALCAQALRPRTRGIPSAWRLRWGAATLCRPCFRRTRAQHVRAAAQFQIALRAVRRHPWLFSCLCAPLQANLQRRRRSPAHFV